MSKLLIINADDFGLCEEISTGIIRAHTQGVVTSTSVVANGRYFEQGVSLLRESGLDAGIHLTFVDGEKPVSGPVDGLVDENGLFLQGYKQVIAKILTGRFDRQAFKRELYDQMYRLMDAGITVTHIDSHQHLHLLPNVRNIVTQLAEQFKVNWIRLPRSDVLNIWRLGMNVLSSRLKSRMRRENLNFTDRNLGFRYGGRLNEARLLSLLKGLRSGITELMVHPGYDATGKYGWEYCWEDELTAVTSEKVKAFIQDNRIELTDYAKI
ncbi:MAG: ChbG/HpnK family deacetylase [Fidelibacterota bacterium]|nr:MAG: ChbG/HpnK family deacetylase [Candidatus Neomarinimicrobiota bacterium]